MRRLITLFTLIITATTALAQGLKLEVHPDKVLNPITPLLYGAGMEDVNHEIYGGLYSQRIFGESFEEGILPEGIKGMSCYDAPIRMDGDAHLFIVLGTEVPGDDHAGTHGNTVEKADHHEDQASGRSHGSQCIFTNEVAHAPGVKGVVKLLKHVAQQNGHGKENDRLPNRPFRHGLLQFRPRQKILLHKSLRKLNPEYRQVLYLVYFEGFTNEEVAAVMKKNKRQIENLIYRAKQTLKVQLDKEGFVYEGL